MCSSSNRGAIYETDEERIMSFDDTVSFSETLRDVYERAGYTLVDVPVDQWTIE